MAELRTGRRIRALQWRMLSIAAAAMLIVPALHVMAEEGPAPVRQGQIILNPETAESAPWLEPAAGAATPRMISGMLADELLSGEKPCPSNDDWQVLVIRGGQTPDLVQGHRIVVTPLGC